MILNFSTFFTATIHYNQTSLKFLTDDQWDVKTWTDTFTFTDQILDPLHENYWLLREDYTISFHCEKFSKSLFLN